MSNRSSYTATVLIAAIGCASLPEGCAIEPAFAFRSQHGEATGPVKRLQVYAPIVTGEAANPVTQVMFDAFQSSLVLRLSLCRVAAEVSPSAPPVVDGSGEQGTGPDHALMIRIADRQIVQVNHYNNGVRYGTTYHGTLYFGIDLADARSRAPAWSARSSFTFPTAERDDDLAGSQFARGIVTQLQRDGLLTGCVREAYPGCRADRSEGRRRAQQITDDRKRFEALRDLPDCE